MGKFAANTRRLRLGLLTILSAGAVLALSPLLLYGISMLVRADWITLSAIGQSYTATATLLSAGALVGVAYSIRLQGRQTELMQQQAVRQMQFDLLQLTMSDSEISDILRIPTLSAGATREGYKEDVFRNQWFRYLEFAFVTGEMTRSALIRALVGEVFVSSEWRRWWEFARPIWEEAAFLRSPAFGSFCAIVQEAYTLTEPAVGDGSIGAGDTDDDSPT